MALFKSSWPPPYTSCQGGAAPAYFILQRCQAWESFTPKDKVEGVASEARFGFCSIFIYVFLCYLRHSSRISTSTCCISTLTLTTDAFINSMQHQLPVSSGFIARLHLLSEQKPVKEQLNNSSGDINYIIEHILAPANSAVKLRAETSSLG